MCSPWSTAGQWTVKTLPRLINSLVKQCVSNVSNGSDFNNVSASREEVRATWHRVLTPDPDQSGKGDPILPTSQDSSTRLPKWRITCDADQLTIFLLDPPCLVTIVRKHQAKENCVGMKECEERIEFSPPRSRPVIVCHRRSVAAPCWRSVLVLLDGETQQQTFYFQTELSQRAAIVPINIQFLPCLQYECGKLVSDRCWAPAVKSNIQFVYVSANHIKIDGFIWEGTD